MSGDHNMHQKPRSYLDDFECPRCGHCCHVEKHRNTLRQALETEQELMANDLLRRAWETLETFRKANPQDWNYADDQLMKDLLRAEAKLREKNT